MKRIVLVLFAILISILSYGQSHLHSGKGDGPATLFDLGGVILMVKEYNYDSCGSSKRQIYKCVFTFKNDNSYPVIFKHCEFYTENVTDSLGNVGCAITRVGTNRTSDTLAANASKVVYICGETPGLYQPAGTPVNKGCTYIWKFGGFIPLKK